MNIPLKLTTTAACRVARIDRDRFNEHVAAGRFQCAPKTVPGRARFFDPNDMIALWLFREFMDDGLDATVAGAMACEIALCATVNPSAKVIALVQDYFHSRVGTAMPAEHAPPHDTWDTVVINGSDIRKVTTYNVDKLRRLIAHYTAEEQSIIGPDD